MRENALEDRKDECSAPRLRSSSGRPGAGPGAGLATALREGSELPSRQSPPEERGTKGCLVPSGTS